MYNNSNGSLTIKRKLKFTFPFERMTLDSSPKADWTTIQYPLTIFHRIKSMTLLFYQLKHLV